MIDKISNFSIIVVLTIIILTLIEMILPDGANKKYITFVSGIILIIVVLNPIMEFANIDINSVLNNNKFEFSRIEYEIDTRYSSEEDIKHTYYEKLKNDIIKRLEENNYIVHDVKFNIDDITYEPKELHLKLENESKSIQPVIIDVMKNQVTKMSNIDEIKIKQILSDTYQIAKQEIYINEGE